MAHMITTWVNTWPAFLEQQEAEKKSASPSQLAALKRMFIEPSTPLSEIAEQITVDTVKRFEEVPGSSDSGLWRTLADGILQLTEYNDKFVELFYEIAEVKIYEVPDLGLTAYWEWWNEFVDSYEEPASTDPNREAIRQSWLNFNAFNAKVSQYRKQHPSLDNRSRISWIKYIVEAPNDKLDLSWGTVPAAAVWFTIDAEAISEMEGEMPGDFRETAWNKTGKKGFSKERFGFWRESFERISKLEDLDEDSRTAAKEAANAMKKVEESK